jgi:hypothetical protein
MAPQHGKFSPRNLLTSSRGVEIARSNGDLMDALKIDLSRTDSALTAGLYPRAGAVFRPMPDCKPSGIHIRHWFSDGYDNKICWKLPSHRATPHQGSAARSRVTAESWSKLLEEKGTEWKGMERKEWSHMILLYIRKGKSRKRKNIRVLYSSPCSGFARLQQDHTK